MPEMSNPSETPAAMHSGRRGQPTFLLRGVGCALSVAAAVAMVGLIRSAVREYQSAAAYYRFQRLRLAAETSKEWARDPQLAFAQEIGLLRRSVKLCPGNALVHYALADRYMADHWDTCPVHGGDIGAEDEADGAGTADRGECTLRLALAHACKAVELSCTNARYHQVLGRVCVALAQCQEIVALEVEGPAARPTIADLKECAVAQLAAACELGANSPMYPYDLGLLLKEMGRWPEALAAFRKSFKRSGEYRRKIRDQVWGQTQSVSQLEAFADDTQQGHLELGQFLFKHGRKRAAMAQMTRALELSANSDVRVRRSIIQFILAYGSAKDAVELLQSWLRCGDDGLPVNYADAPIDLVLMLASAYGKAKRPEAVVSLLEGGIRARLPSASRLVLALAKHYASQGRRGDAIRVIKAFGAQQAKGKYGFDGDPRRFALIARLAGLYAETGSYEKAAETYKDLLRSLSENDPRRGWLTAALARCYMRLHRVSDVLPLYRSLVKQNPKQARAHFELAQALEAAGDLPAALRSYQAAAALNPGYAGKVRECQERISKTRSARE